MYNKMEPENEKIGVKDYVGKQDAGKESARQERT